MDWLEIVKRKNSLKQSFIRTMDQFKDTQDLLASNVRRKISQC